MGTLVCRATTLIKSLLAVAVAGTFATAVSAADLPYQNFDYVNPDGTVVPGKIHENFVFLNAGLSTAQGRLDDHNNRLTDAEGKVTSLGAQVTGLIDGLTADEADILTNKNNIAQNATNIADNTGRLTDVEGRLDRHDTRLMTAEDKVTMLRGTVIEHGNRLTTAEGTLTEHGNRLTTAEGTLTEHGNRLTTAEGKVTTLEGTVTEHGNRLTTAEGRIDLNSHAIADNYKEMKNNFAAVNSRIDKLDDKMKKGFASQAALNGLFQPYNVGKFNVSAAIGGYDSEQAMALGAGYRLNKNFAIKAGIASDLSGFDHVTYNVGANFEF